MRLFGIVITVTVVLSLLAASQAHAALIPKLEWKRTHDGPSHHVDAGNGVALDSAGNVYVTGYENNDDLGQWNNIWLGKYDTNGNVLWTKTYDSPYHRIDSANDVTVDSNGNVYVTGSVQYADPSLQANTWVRKYDSDGNVLWTDIYNGPAGLDDGGCGIAVDAEGNVYVTGLDSTDTWVGGRNIWLRKYDTNGSVLWTQSYDDPAHSPAYGYGVALDSAGNIYVTGCENNYDLDQSGNIWLGKYDAQGNLQWTQTHDGPAHDYDFGQGVTIDGEGNVYVTGYESLSSWGGPEEIWIGKYDPDGNLLWETTYHYSQYDYHTAKAYDIAVDAAGNVYVTGREYISGVTQMHDILILKYAQVPEPSTLLLLAPALLGIAGALRKRSQK